MSAAAALNVVKQIQAVAEGPPTPEMRACLGQVVSSLLLFLDHPDSRVRLGAARTLLKLTEGYKEEVKALDLTRARSAMTRCKEAITNGSSDADGEELHRLLKEMLADETKEQVSPSKVPSVERPLNHDSETGGRGEVVLKVGAQADDGKVKAAILEKAVGLAGVVSVTFEGAFVIVSTRCPEIAADAAFLADLLMLFREEGIQGVSLVSAAAASSSSPSTSPSKVPSAAAASTGPGPSASSGVEHHQMSDDEEDGEDEEPAYLDDDDEEEDGGGGGGGGPRGIGGPGGLGGGPGGAAHWSFFAQNNWMTGRRLQEFGDDPTIAARLAKAKKREEEKKAEEKTRIGRLSSWLTGTR